MSSTPNRLFELEETAPANGRVGTRNAARTVIRHDPPPWAAWHGYSLPARCIRFLSEFCIPAKGHGHGQPLKVARWQSDWIEAVLADELDPITSSILTLGRGNGKSTFAGGFATWAVFDSELAEAFGGQPQIPVVAPVLRQAVKGVYGAALAFVKNHPELRSRALVYSAAGNERLVVPGNHDGELFPASSDVDGLQGLDPGPISFVDEVGFVPVDTWDAVLLAAGKRPRSLTLGLGTRSPGETPNALDHVHGQLQRLGRIPGLLFVDYSADPDCDIADPDQWRKANPALAEGYLRESALTEALALSGETAFRVFRLNQKAGAVDGWLGGDGPALWDTLEHPYELTAGAPTWLGIDVSLRHDATAVVAVQRRPDARWHAIARVWTAGAGQTIPFDEVEHHLRTLSHRYRLVDVAYDPRYFGASAQRLYDEGLPMLEVPQSHARMVPLVGETYRALVSKQVTHDHDPTFRSHVLSAVPRFGDTTGFSLSKLKSGIHIDAAVALCLALGHALSGEMVPDDPLAGLTIG